MKYLLLHFNKYPILIFQYQSILLSEKCLVVNAFSYMAVLSNLFRQKDIFSNLRKCLVFILDSVVKYLRKSFKQ